MSGHSKWSQIKRKKEILDGKRGQQFTKLAIQIKQAATQGSNPQTNATLAEAIHQAKKANMPQVNIDRLLSKSDEAQTEQLTYEAFGPNGCAMIINTTTDNSRRTVAEIRAILKNHNCTLGEPGSVMWKFDNTAETLTPKYPLSLDEDSMQKVNDLIEELKNHPDVQKVHTELIS